jgi:hypothetical protein
MGRYEIILVCKMPDGKLILVSFWFRFGTGLSPIFRLCSPPFEAISSIRSRRFTPRACQASAGDQSLVLPWNRKRPDAHMDPKMVC